MVKKKASEKVERFPLPLKDKNFLRNGKHLHKPQDLKSVSAKINGFGEPIPGTAGWLGHVDMGSTVRMISRMRSQHWSAEHSFKSCMSKNNKGTLWLRRQDDPEAAFAYLWDTVGTKKAKPHLRYSYGRIKEATADGQILTRDALHKAGEQPRHSTSDWLVDNLVECGALVDEQDGPHKAHRVYRVVGDATYNMVVDAIMKDIKSHIIKLWIRARTTADKLIFVISKGIPLSISVRDTQSKNLALKHPKYKAIIQEHRSLESLEQEKELFKWLDSNYCGEIEGTTVSTSSLLAQNKGILNAVH